MHIKYFTNYFGTKVDNAEWKITIPFHSEEDFNRIIKLINE
jgi:ParB family chromosome partitioning protein